MKITRRQLRRIIRESIRLHELESRVAHEEEVSMYDVGRDDALGGVPPQDDDDNYMMGYNDVLIDMGEPPVGPPAEGSGKPLDPNMLQYAHVGGRR